MPKKKTKSVKAPTGNKVSVIATGPLDVGSILDSATTDKKSKVKSPKLNMDEPKKGIVAELKEAYKTMTDAKANFESLSNELKDSVIPVYRQTLANGADFVNTVQVQNSNSDAVQVQFKHAYSKIPKDQASALIEVVGSKYGDFFKETAKIEVKADVINNPVLLKELIGKIGDGFAKYFQVEQFIVPKENFTKTRFSGLTGDQNAQLDATVKQYSPSVKVR